MNVEQIMSVLLQLFKQNKNKGRKTNKKK